LETGEGKLHLGLDSCRDLDSEVVRRVDDALEKCALSNSRIAAEHQDLAASAAYAVEELDERTALLRAPDQLA
jgi:U3 small nucleolar RNA-associated protein 14